MGQAKSQFTDEELQDYEDLTFFTKKEILLYVTRLCQLPMSSLWWWSIDLILSFHTYSAHKKFKALAPEKVGHNKNAKLSMAKVLQYPELKVNPFGDQICKVFSSSNDGDCTFEDFLDMMSVFSDAAPRSVKAEHAFRIFGRNFKRVVTLLRSYSRLVKVTL